MEAQALQWVSLTIDIEYYFQIHVQKIYRDILEFCQSSAQ